MAKAGDSLLSAARPPPVPANRPLPPAPGRERGAESGMRRMAVRWAPVGRPGRVDGGDATARGMPALARTGRLRYNGPPGGAGAVPDGAGRRRG